MTFKDRLTTSDDRMTAHICTIPSPVVTQAMAGAGADAIIVDMEHGAIDFGTAHAMMAAVAGTGCAPWVRVPEIDEATVKRVLDLGAEGVVFPLVNTAADAERAIACLHYPPRGNRGFGPFIAHAHYGQDMMTYAKTFPDRVVSCLLTETAAAVEDIEAICAVPGIDMIVPAQFDLSVSLGLPGQFDHPEFVAAVRHIEEVAGAAGIPLGGVALSEAQAKANMAKGYRVFVGFDTLWLGAKTVEAQAWCTPS